MTVLKKLKNRISAFKQDEDGILTVEALMIFPLLLWTITFTFTAFEGFRQSASNLKAAYTVSDLISRESTAVTDVYIDSLHELMGEMINNRSDVFVRISLIRFDETDDRHYVDWSTVRGYEAEWNDDNIHEIEDRLPPMPDQDTLILVESSNEYIPAFKPGWDFATGITFTNFVFTRPRFGTKVACDLVRTPSVCVDNQT
ncbi:MULTISPECIES: TadE/TadG family type IV pilus assembly protein [unclassified Ruegeria]|uniref:TadE/TadG family type IV pilus assembly protein n=1 Tax=unclassified Ruegeria TaxID=2625375 RepID=UPI0014878D3D|nr:MULTISPECIES: pilus assembly protein [unclassified Ruegeria]NOD63762.1 pilus assembly protein [Ruegeria sp. HKCCD6109]